MSSSSPARPNQSQWKSQLYHRTSQVWERGTNELIEALADLTQNALHLLLEEQKIPVRSPVDPQDVPEKFSLKLPTQPQSIQEVMQGVMRLLLSAPTTSGPRFFNQLFAGHDPAGTPADMLASLCNHSMYTYKIGGPLIVMEEQVLCGLRRLAGFPEKNGGGIFTPGGSLSNFAAMLCARDRIAPQAKENGIPLHLKIYCSEEAHYSVTKGASMMGLGRASVRAIPSDDLGIMNPAQLNQHIIKDRNEGFMPMMIIATAGTTVLGAFDPIVELVEIAQKENIWLHVDGAFGGSALWSDELKNLCKGLEQADSFTWDAHKAMGLPLTCSALLTRDPLVLTQAFSEQASYLFQGEVDLMNPGMRSLQCGRRNDALKLWAAWQYHGDQGWAERTNRLRSLACALAELIKDRPNFSLHREPMFLNVSLEYKGRSSISICENLEKEQRALVGYAYSKGRCVIRVAVINPELTLFDLKTLLDDIESVADYSERVDF